MNIGYNINNRNNTYNINNIEKADKGIIQNNYHFISIIAINKIKHQKERSSMISELLKKGKENRIGLNELMKMTGYSDIRLFRKQLADERKNGAVILSCPEGGYYLPETKEEVERYIKTKSKEARSIFFMLKPAREYLKEMERREGV